MESVKSQNETCPKKSKFKKHFRFNILVKHPAYIFKEEDGYYYFFYITHSWTVNDIKTIPLTSSIDASDAKHRSYIVPIVFKARKNKFWPPVKKFKFCRKDGPIIRELYKKFKIKP